VNVEHASPVVVRQVLEVDGLEDSRVAHDRVEATEPSDGGAHNGVSADSGGHRVVRRNGHATGGLDLLDHPGCDGPVPALTVHGATDVIDHDGRAAASQFEGVETPEPAAPAGDDNHLPAEVDHGKSVPPEVETKY
jgi:hypothetical protein